MGFAHTHTQLYGTNRTHRHIQYTTHTYTQLCQHLFTQLSAGFSFVTCRENVHSSLLACVSPSVSYPLSLSFSLKLDLSISWFFFRHVETSLSLYILFIHPSHTHTHTTASILRPKPSTTGSPFPEANFSQFFTPLMFPVSSSSIPLSCLSSSSTCLC